MKRAISQRKLKEEEKIKFNLINNAYSTNKKPEPNHKHPASV